VCRCSQGNESLHVQLIVSDDSNAMVCVCCSEIQACTYVPGQLKYAKPMIPGSAQSNKDFILCRHTAVNDHRLKLASEPFETINILHGLFQ
jgi:hypothetical protein